MKPVEPITPEDIRYQKHIHPNADIDSVVCAILETKLNELTKAHNELLAKYESHTHPVMRTDDVYEDSLVTEIPQP